MRHTALSLLAALALAGPAEAACYAGYKAKQDNPLRLHFGVIQLERCDGRDAVAREVAERLRAAGWTLLNVMEIREDPPNAQQRANAGDFYLRY